MNELTDASYSIELMDLRTVRFCIDTRDNNPALCYAETVRKCMTEYAGRYPAVTAWEAYYQGPLLYIVVAGGINIDNLRKFNV